MNNVLARVTEVNFDKDLCFYLYQGITNVPGFYKLHICDID